VDAGDSPFVLVAEIGDGDSLFVVFADAALLQGAALAVFGRGPIKLGAAVVGVDDLHAEGGLLALRTQPVVLLPVVAEALWPTRVEAVGRDEGTDALLL
jgi:hypothetical protein